MDKWMSNNNFNKVLALLLAIVLWTIVHFDGGSASTPTALLDSKIIENVKIQLTGFDADEYEVTTDADSVRLEVQGRSSDIFYQLSDSYKVTLDLSGVEPGTYKMPLEHRLPNGVSLVDMSPREVSVRIERRNTNEYPVTIEVNGEPAEGYQVGTPVVTPSVAKVTLPDSDLERVARVQGVIELNGESSAVTERRVRLTAYDGEGNELSGAVIEPGAVSVEVPVTLPYKSVPLDIGYSGRLPDGVVMSSLTAEDSSVVVYGPEETLEGITSYRAVVDLSGVDSAGTTELQAELTPPEGTERIEPSTMTFTVVTEEVVQRTFEDIPIQLEGTPEGMEAELTSPPGGTVGLTLSGARTLLNGLRAADIGAVADIGGLGAGSHQVTLQLSLPDFVTLTVPSDPPSVSVELYVPGSTPTPDGTEGTPATPTPEPDSEPVTGNEDDPEATETPGEPTATPSPSPTASPSPGTGGEESQQSGAAAGGNDGGG